MTQGYIGGQNEYGYSQNILYEGSAQQKQNSAPSVQQSYLATAPNMTNNPSVTGDVMGSKQMVVQNNPNVPVSAISPVSQMNIPVPQQVPLSTYTTPITAVPSELSILQENAKQAQDAKDKANADMQGLSGIISGLEGANVKDIAGTYASTGVNTAYNRKSELAAQAVGLQNEASAIPIQNALAYRGNAGVQSGVETTNRDQLAQNALKALSLGQQYAIASGEYDRAKNYADQLIETKYAGEEARIKSLRTLQDSFDKYTLTPLEQKRLEAVKKATDLADRQLTEKIDTEKSIQNIGMTLRKYGVDDKVVNDVLSSTNINDAIRKAGTNLKDPKAKLELEGLRLDHINKKIQAQKSSYEMQLLQKYGGMSPSEYRKEVKEEQKQIQEASDLAEKSRLQGMALDKKITLLGSVLNSDAIDSVVGSSFASRSATGFGGFLGRFAAGATAGAGVGAVAGFPLGGVGAIPGAVIGGAIGGTSLALQGSKDYFTGSADKLVGQTEQFISKEFIDSLVSAKSAGATFGALTKPEQEALTAAASFIGQRRIYEGAGEDKTVVGYDMSEQDFKRELGTIKTLTEKAYETSTGKTYSSDEKLFLDKAFDGSLNNNTSSPEAYY